MRFKDNIKAHYKLNGAKDPTTGNVLDSSGHNIDGTIIGGETYTKNQIGKQVMILNDESETIQHLNGTDGLTFNDTIGVLSDAKLIQSNCLTSTGNNTISIPQVVIGDVIENNGTATGSCNIDGIMEFTAGTISQITINGILMYTCGEGYGLPLDIYNGDYDVTAMTTVWNKDDNIPSVNNIFGHTNYCVFNNGKHVVRSNIGFNNRGFTIIWEGIIPYGITGLEAIFSNGSYGTGGNLQGIIVSDNALTAIVTLNGVDRHMSFDDYDHYDVPVRLTLSSNPSFITLRSEVLFQSRPTFNKNMFTSEPIIPSDQVFSIGGVYLMDTGQFAYPFSGKCSRFIVKKETTGGDGDRKVVFDAVPILDGMGDLVNLEKLLQPAGSVDVEYIPPLQNKTTSVASFDGNTWGKVKSYITTRRKYSWETRFKFENPTLGSAQLMGGVTDSAASLSWGISSNGYWTCVIGTATPTESPVLADSDWHTFKLLGYKFYIDDVLVYTLSGETATYPSELYYIAGYKQYNQYNIDYRCIGKCAWVKITDIDTGEIMWNPDFTTESGIMWSYDRDYMDSKNVRFESEGGDVATISARRNIDESGKYVDALYFNDPSYTGDYLANNSEGLIIQTDPALLSNPVWSQDGSNFIGRSYGDMLAHINTYDVYFRTKRLASELMVLTDGTTENNALLASSVYSPVDFDPINFSIIAKINSPSSLVELTRPIFEKINGSDYIIRISLEGADGNQTLSFTGRSEGLGYGIPASYTSKILNDGMDHIIMCNFDGDTWNIYVDGELTDTLGQSVSLTNNNSGCNIGKDITTNFDGNIGDLMVFDRVLSIEEYRSLIKHIDNPPKYTPSNTNILNEIITSDESWVLAIRDGLTNLIDRTDIITTFAIIGENMQLHHGTVNWDSVNIISQMFTYEPYDGSGIKHYARCGSTNYINGMETVEDLPFAINDTGISGTVSGVIHMLNIYNVVKDGEFIKTEYIKESRYW